MKINIEKIAKIVRISIFALIGSFLLYCVVFFWTNPQNPEYTDCGRVVSKSQDEVVIKHGTETNLYLNVQFKNSGFKSVCVQPTTYFKTKVGEKVCFDLDKEVSTWYSIKYLMGIIVQAIIVLVLVIVLIMFLFYPWLKV